MNRVSFVRKIVVGLCSILFNRRNHFALSVLQIFSITAIILPIALILLFASIYYVRKFLKNKRNSTDDNNLFKSNNKNNQKTQQSTKTSQLGNNNNASKNVSQNINTNNNNTKVNNQTKSIEQNYQKNNNKIETTTPNISLSSIARGQQKK